MNSATERAYLDSLNRSSAVDRATRDALGHLGAYERAAAIDPVGQATREALEQLGGYERAAAVDPVGQATREALEQLGAISGGLSEHLRATIGPSLAANEVASFELSKQLKGSNGIQVSAPRQCRPFSR